MPGHPDIVLRKWHAVILVHGCFWHRHAGCRFAYSPKSRTDFWENKFRINVARDISVKEKLERLGWRVGIVWECQTANPAALAGTLEGFIYTRRRR